MARTFLCLGSNLGDSRRHLEAAIELIRQEVGEIVAQSALYQTEPWGFSSENLFINQVIEVETSCSLFRLFRLIQDIERRLGRTKNNATATYSDRIIDIDILAYNDSVINTLELCVPHPQMEKRRFVLEPLCDIAPTWIHPVLLKSARKLLEECPDNGRVLKIVVKS